MEALIDLGQGLYQLNLIAEEEVSRTSAYILKDQKTILIETGPSLCNKTINQALAELGTQLDAVIVTHIHLDHAGGAGLLLEQHPQAVLLVHPRGAEHMLDTSRLEASARQVYGEAFETLFAPIKDCPKERVRIMADRSTYALAPGRELTFYHAEGHARHHFMVFDPKTESLFTGDAAGMTYPRLKEHYDVDFCLPASTPTQFDPAAMEATMDFIHHLAPNWVYFTHFGGTNRIEWLVKEIKHWLKFYSKEVPKAYQAHHHRIEELKAFMLERILLELEDKGVPRDNEALEQLQFDTDLNAQGIVSWLKRGEK